MGLNICVTQPRDVGKYLFWDDVPLNEWDHARMTGDRESQEFQLGSDT